MNSKQLLLEHFVVLISGRFINVPTKNIKYLHLKGYTLVFQRRLSTFLKITLLNLVLIKSCFQATAATHLAALCGCQLPLNALSIISLFTHRHIIYPLWCIYNTICWINWQSIFPKRTLVPFRWDTQPTISSGNKESLHNIYYSVMRGIHLKAFIYTCVCA